MYMPCEYSQPVFLAGFIYNLKECSIRPCSIRGQNKVRSNKAGRPTARPQSRILGVNLYFP